MMAGIHTYIKRLSVVILLMPGFMSCQRVIDVQIANASQQLVIEGNLTDKSGTQIVVISRSIAYSSTNVFPTVSGAKVYFTDATGNIYNLPETSKAGTYATSFFKAKALNMYSLTVKTDGKIYTANSLMPLAVNLDSLTLSGQVFGNKTIKTVSVNYSDPPGVPNQYRFIMYVNGVQIKRIFTENDNLTDGRMVNSPLYESEVELKTGDRVEVEMQCIDANMYNYWNSLGSQGGNSPADSSTPSNPPSNFDNNVLGYFSAHTVQRKSIVIP